MLLELVNEIGTLENTGVKVSLHLAAAEAAPEILARSDEIGADLIVIGNRGWTSFRSFVLGSVASRVLRHATCPVITCREPRIDSVGSVFWSALDPRGSGVPGKGRSRIWRG